jgi:hypothetical protein
MRQISTAATALLRELDRVVKRKRALPEDDDINKLLTLCGVVNKENTDVVKELSLGFPDRTQ